MLESRSPLRVDSVVRRVKYLQYFLIVKRELAHGSPISERGIIRQIYAIEQPAARGVAAPVEG